MWLNGELRKRKKAEDRNPLPPTGRKKSQVKERKLLPSMMSMAGCFPSIPEAGESFCPRVLFPQHRHKPGRRMFHSSYVPKLWPSAHQKKNHRSSVTNHGGDNKVSPCVIDSFEGLVKLL